MKRHCLKAALASAVKAKTFATQAASGTLRINSVASPAAMQALTGLDVNLVTKALPGPLQ